MNFLKIIYFHIYNTYYKDGHYKNDIPYLTAYGITGTSLGCLILALLTVLNYGFTRTRLSVVACLIIFLLCLIVFFVLFIHNARYKEVYASIKGSRWDTAPMKVIVWIIIGLGFASVGLYSYIFNNR